MHIINFSYLISVVLITNTDDLKVLIRVLKAEKVAHFKGENVELTFAPAAFLPELSAAMPGATDSMTDEERKKAEDEITFWSAGK